MDIGDLFAEHFDPLCRYVTRLTGDPDLAADVAQQAFIRWVERKPEESNPKAWLYAVATNLVRDTRRVQARRLTLLSENPDSVPVADAPDRPDQRLESREAVALVRAILAELPERDRVLLLMQQEGFTHAEMAEAVGTTAKSVGTLLARALKKFSARVGESREILGRQ